MTNDLQQAAERVAKVRNGESHIHAYDDEFLEAALARYDHDCELLANAYLEQRAEILAACLEESTYDGLYRRMMEVHERGE